jgi:hypothetical protein
LDQLIQILITDLPEDKETVITFAQQLKQKGLQQGLQQGEHRKALVTKSKDRSFSSLPRRVGRAFRHRYIGR